MIEPFTRLTPGFMTELVRRVNALQPGPVRSKISPRFREPLESSQAADWATTLANNIKIAVEI